MVSPNCQVDYEYFWINNDRFWLKNGHCNVISEKNTILCQKMRKVDDTGFTSYTLINPMF